MGDLEPASSSTREIPPQESGRVLARFKYLNEKSVEAFRVLHSVSQTTVLQRGLVPLVSTAFKYLEEQWSHQQRHRCVLDAHGLRRCEIGEIGCRIAQLYYFAYLWFSSVESLELSRRFYNRISTSEYFHSGPKDVVLARRRLRVAVRHILVCLLLGRYDYAEEVVTKELEKVANDISDLRCAIASRQSSNPTGAITYSGVNLTVLASEANMVLQEARSFLDADRLRRSANISYRLPHTYSPPLHHADEALVLTHAVLAMNPSYSVKFSEVPLDVLRIMLTLEWESRTSSPESTSPTPTLPLTEPRMNVEKTLLYRPTVEKVVATVSAALSECEMVVAAMSQAGLSKKKHVPGVLVYLNAQGEVVDGTTAMALCEVDKQSEIFAEGSNTSRHFTAADLQPLLYRPVFLIIESPVSKQWARGLAAKGQPLVIVLSSSWLPPRLGGFSREAASGVLTYFLSAPLLALAQLLQDQEDATSPSAAARNTAWEAPRRDIPTQCRGLVDECVQAIGEYLVSTCTHPFHLAFLTNPFTAGYLARFVFGHMVISSLYAKSHHTHTHEADVLPEIIPPLPSSVYSHPPALDLLNSVQELLVP